MCGIAGWIDFGGGPDEGVVAAMTGILRHRGPDNISTARAGEAALGHARLSIIDLAERSNQPMLNPDTGDLIVFNGEIYNFLELRKELEEGGYRCRTSGDTEVILALYARHGADCLAMLRGMFAFAIWNPQRREAFIARDRLGKKPLYYALTKRGLVFASELRGVAAHPQVETEIDPEALDLYLTRSHVPAPHTIYKAVRKLPPAHFARFGADGLRMERYWRLDYGRKIKVGEAEALELVERELTEAVRLRLIADVPLGALLSGGVDSSLVVALMSRLTPKVLAFSIGFDEEKFNELPHAAKVAAHLGVEHHHQIVRPEAAALLPKVVRHYGEPFADGAALPSFYLAEMARGHITVALNGDGGDELACGYTSYAHAVFAARLASVLRPDPRGLERRMARLYADRSALGGALRKAFWKYRCPEAKYLLRDELAAAKLKDAVLTPEAWEAAGGAAYKWRLAGVLESFERADNPVERLLWIDNVTALPDGLLVKMDIAAMAYALEVRSPLLDSGLVELCASLPWTLKVRGRETKYILKKIAEKYLPHDVLYRRKQGFAMPLAAWLRGPLRDFCRDALISARSGLAGYLDFPAVDRLMDEHVSGRSNQATSLWKLLNLALWDVMRRSEVRIKSPDIP